LQLFLFTRIVFIKFSDRPIWKRPEELETVMDEAERIVAARLAQEKAAAQEREEIRRQDLLGLIPLLVPYAVDNIRLNNYPSGRDIHPLLKCITEIGGDSNVVWGTSDCGIDDKGEVVFYTLGINPHAIPLSTYTRSVSELKRAACMLHDVATSLTQRPVERFSHCTWQCRHCMDASQHYETPYSIPIGYPWDELQRVVGIVRRQEQPPQAQNWLDRLVAWFFG
jgi:hypothetical protein